MKSSFIIVSFLLLSITSCSSQKELKAFPFPIKEVYFQKWIGGQEASGTGIDLYLKVNEPFSANFQVKTVWFMNKQAIFQKVDSTTYVAHFEDKQSKEAPKKYTNLASNEAIVELEQDHIIQQFKVTNIKEKELLAYPSTRPRN